MFARGFLGWHRPFVMEAADWLLRRGDALAKTLVVTPTTHGGRRLREAMVVRAGALLSPRMVTPAWFLRTPDPDVAPDWVERVAWMEVLERAGTDAALDALFPGSGGLGEAGVSGLAREWLRLRKRLQENGHTLCSAAAALSSSPDADRWTALAGLERAMLGQLRVWGFRGRSEVLAAGLRMQPEVEAVVLAGVTDMPPLVERLLAETPVPVTVLIGAPSSEADGFSPSGRPLPEWAERPLPWPEESAGSVSVSTDARQQAAEAFRLVCGHGLASDRVALGAVDPAVASELERVFTRGGWPAFNPAADPVRRGAARCLGLWADWVGDDRLAVLQDLLALPEAECLDPARGAVAALLATHRDKAMGLRGSAMARRIRAMRVSDPEREQANRQLAEVLERACQWRDAWRGGDPAATLQDTIARFTSVGSSDPDGWRDALDWVVAAEPVMRRVRPRDPVFWLRLCLEELDPLGAVPADDRVIDVLGWLELGFEAGEHLVVAGMNEGRVPAALGADPWVGEATAQWLGLVTDAQRASRDAFLLRSMVESRWDGGRVDLLCGKTGAGGEALLPSRLLVAASGEELARRVAVLFRELEPPDAGLRWQADWRWRPRPMEEAPRLSATAMAAWLDCPFRFYLKHVMRMEEPEPDRVEWNARDFGTMAHEVMEAWGRDQEALQMSKAEALQAWLSAELDRRVRAAFGQHPPMAVRIQTEALRQRLGWVAHEQACLRAEGWETVAVEPAHVIQFGAFMVKGRIDRIDRHPDGRVRVIDYKTGKVDNVEAHHRRRVIASTRPAAHLPMDSPVFHSVLAKGKFVSHRWVNLQLLLYAMALMEQDGVLPEPCFFQVGSTRSAVGLNAWNGFSVIDLEAARECAAWVIEQIVAGVFWPPASKSVYDDFASLGACRPFEDLFDPVPETLTSSS